MAAAPLFLAAAGVQAVGSIAQGAQARQASQYNAQVYENEAAYQRQLAAIEDRQARRDAEKALSTQRAKWLASGVDISEGSPLLALETSAANAEYDALVIRYGGETRAKSSEAAAEQERTQGEPEPYWRRAGCGGLALNRGRSLSAGEGGQNIDAHYPNL